MKTLLFLSLILPAALATEKPAPPPESPPARKPEITSRSDRAAAALALYRGKKGKPTRNVMSATRSGDQPPIQIAALAPGNEGVTHLEQPRLWWYQSGDTRGGELEFVLSDLSASPPAVLHRQKIPPMKAGYNVIDLKNPKANPDGIKLRSGVVYQWTINLRSDREASPVYCRIQREDSGKTQTPDLQALSDHGNWYELFDQVATPARAGDPDFAAARSRLLDSIGLGTAAAESSAESP